MGKESLLRIHLFGGLALFYDDILLPPVPGSAARSLLAYLIFHHNQPIFRDCLTGLFWPERPDARARRALSQALWQIRHALGPAADRLVAEQETVTFQCRSGDWLDVIEFQLLCATSLTQVISEQASRYHHATELYCGDFLQDIYDDWALVERERLRELYLGALDRLVTAYKQSSNFEQALICAQRLAAADPLRESAHREMMRLYHLIGRPQAALQQFATLRDLLGQELGAPPGPATIALYQEIAAAAVEASPPHLPIALPPPPLLRDLSHLPFVGRTSERQELLSALQAAAQGRGGLALIEGDAGVGKTRLAGELVAEARWRKFQVGQSKADPLAGCAPYQLWLDALSPLLTPLRITQLAELVEPHWLAIATQLFPAITQHLPDLSPPASVAPEAEQGRLNESVAHCLAGLAAASPVLLILEDAHWADDASLAALLGAAPLLPTHCVLIALTCRAAESRERAAVGEALESLARALPITRLELSAFEPAEAVTLIRQALGTGYADRRATSFAEYLQSEAGGNALFLVEMLKSLLEQGNLVHAPESGWTFPCQADPLPTPASIQELVTKRLERLLPALRNVLEWLAILGEEASFTALARASQVGTPALLTSLRELEQRGFVVEAQAQYRFEHDRIREIVHQAISPEQRRVLHRQAGAILEQLRPDHNGALAHHFAHGQVWDKAVIYNRQAGDQAKSVYAGAQAIAYYGQAIAAWQHLPAFERQLGLSLYMERGRICQETGRFDQAEADFGAAGKLAEQLNDKDNQACALNHQSYLQFQRGDFGGAAAIAQQALDLSSKARLSSEIAAGFFNKANALRNQGCYSEAIELYEQAAAIFERLDDQTRLADCLNRMGAALYRPGGFARGYELVERALAIRRRLDDKVGIAYSLVNMSALCNYQGQFARSRQAAQEALEIARAIGDPYGEDAALCNLGITLVEQGFFDQAIASFERALQIARSIGDRALEPEALVYLGRAFHLVGDVERARNSFEDALRMVLDGVERRLSPLLYIRLAQLDLSLSRYAEAWGYARAGLQAAREFKEPWGLGVAQRTIAEVAQHLSSETTSLEPSLYFEESIRILREIGAQAELARSLAAYGLYLEPSADPKAAQGGALLDEAQAMFQRMEMNSDLAQLEAEADAPLRPTQVSVRLPRADVPTGRPLRDEELVQVMWTIAAPDDDEIPDPSDRRRHRLLRLLQEAAKQSAAPTVEALASALGVTDRTIKRDLAALRAVGHQAATRGHRG